MQEKIHLLILSDHILPNYLFIKEKIVGFSRFIFITTPYVEQKEIGINLENALGLNPGSAQRIIVEEDNFLSIIESLKKENFSKDAEYWINQTGGTKVMSTAIYEFFREYDSHFVYIPFGKNIYYNFKNMVSENISYRLSLEEYLKLYGLRLEYDNKLLKPANETFKLFDRIKGRGFFLPGCIKNAQSAETPIDRKYYSGAWFEEYTYLRLKKEYSLPDDAIAMSAKIYRKNSKNTDNEIDVIFIKDNMLHIIECKVTMWGYGKKPQAIVEDYLYKLAAISKDLGLKVNSYLFTIHKLDTMGEEAINNIEKRAQILGVKKIIATDSLKKENVGL